MCLAWQSTLTSRSEAVCQKYLLHLVTFAACDQHASLAVLTHNQWKIHCLNPWENTETDERGHHNRSSSFLKNCLCVTFVVVSEYITVKSLYCTDYTCALWAPIMGTLREYGPDQHIHKTHSSKCLLLDWDIGLGGLNGLKIYFHCYCFFGIIHYFSKGNFSFVCFLCFVLDLLACIHLDMHRG